MFARFLRSAPYVAFAAVVGACLKVVAGPFLAAMGPRAEGHMLYEGLSAATSHWLTVAIFAVVFGLLYGSVVESRVGR